MSDLLEKSFEGEKNYQDAIKMMVLLIQDCPLALKNINFSFLETHQNVLAANKVLDIMEDSLDFYYKKSLQQILNLKNIEPSSQLLSNIAKKYFLAYMLIYSKSDSIKLRDLEQIKLGRSQLTGCNILKKNYEFNSKNKSSLLFYFKPGPCDNDNDFKNSTNPKLNNHIKIKKLYSIERENVIYHPTYMTKIDEKTRILAALHSIYEILSYKNNSSCFKKLDQPAPENFIYFPSFSFTWNVMQHFFQFKPFGRE